MNPKNLAGSTPVFIEVPKPVNQMSKKEVDGFVDEIMEAIDGQTPATSCPQCSSKTGIGRSFMDFQMDQ